MNYQEFVGSVTGFLRESLPCDTELKLVPLEKNNGVVIDGLTVRKNGQKIAPTIYLESYYRDYMEGRSLGTIYDQILECCEDCDYMEKFDVGFFADYRKIQPTVVYKLINFEKNKELLQRVPHLPFLDLAIVFYCLLRDTPVGNATILIHNSHLELWKISCSQLYLDARNNTQRLMPAELKTMSDVIWELSDGLDEASDAQVPMYVLTNTRRVLGAASILYDGMLNMCGRRLKEAYYLLPSSIHEWILVPASVVPDRRELLALVRDINATQVRNTEVLSDQIYLYLPESGQISIIND